MRASWRCRRSRSLGPDDHSDLHQLRGHHRDFLVSTPLEARGLIVGEDICVAYSPDASIGQQRLPAGAGAAGVRRRAPLGRAGGAIVVRRRLRRCTSVSLPEAAESDQAATRRVRAVRTSPSPTRCSRGLPFAGPVAGRGGRCRRHHEAVRVHAVIRPRGGRPTASRVHPHHLLSATARPGMSASRGRERHDRDRPAAAAGGGSASELLSRERHQGLSAPRLDPAGWPTGRCRRRARVAGAGVDRTCCTDRGAVATMISTRWYAASGLEDAGDPYVRYTRALRLCLTVAHTLRSGCRRTAFPEAALAGFLDCTYRPGRAEG